MAISAAIWENLVVETQFATELTLTGLRQLCSVPTDPALVSWGSKNLNYALHVGLYSYTSGLERLCKLAIACHEYTTNGAFPELRSYSHKIGPLLDAVEKLTSSEPGTSINRGKYLVRPQSHLDPGLTNMLERFASGSGRYEHLDSLWNDKVKVDTYNEWSNLAANASVSKKVRNLIAMKEAMVYAISSELSNDGLESVALYVIGDLEVQVFEPSVGVALHLFRKVRWIATVLDTATYYTTKDLPILGEVIAPMFIHPAQDFFNYHIAKVGDKESVSDELKKTYKRIRVREAESNDVR